MSPRVFRDVSFFRLLRVLDLDLAGLVRDGGCAVCGGPLHAARYPRKLRGVPEEAAAFFTKRESFCCGKDSCRRRTTPPSVVFFGRRLYPAAMVVLVSALAHGASERRLGRLHRLFEVDRRTVLRWQALWCETFSGSDFYRAEAGRFSPPLSRRRPVRDLLRRFAGTSRDQLLSVLLFFSPLTTGSVSIERARRWAAKTRRGGVVTAF